VRIDLHAHTTHSDGTLEPQDLVRHARAVGLAALAVTDHDTTSALPRAREVGIAEGVEIIDGCEVSASMNGMNVHVLAYGFRPTDPAFLRFLESVCVERDVRNEAILARLSELGVPVTHEEVNVHVRGRIVARPHVARALVDRGYVPDVRTAFQRYLGDRAPAFVAGSLPSPAVAIGAIVAAGGVAVLAHPRQLRLEGREGYAPAIAAMAEAGLTGIEVDHPSHEPADRALFRELAASFGLVASGGSDFHGSNKPHIALGSGDGTIDVAYETWERLKERRR
jgi:predicted metal-dependent phosphoesterase TrpH